ncbi:hypothetical protein [Mesomycoplasma ovipneumoniae]|uniref:hypothetical protein n=1 Tax=Mesomycoplasma ovipneumoniae TaxID=29562 RepID=UPI00083E9220|nr:hypothetical protein [Mesomycoplasma ovipneumoniae]
MSFNKKKYLFLAPLIVLPWIFPAIIFALQNKNNNFEAKISNPGNNNLFNIDTNDNENLKSNISPNNDLFTINVKDSEALKSNIFSYYDLVRMDKKRLFGLKIVNECRFFWTTMKKFKK